SRGTAAMAEAARNSSPASTTSHHKFKVIKAPTGAPESSYPCGRSGHRTFVDSDFLYVIGGFTDAPEDRILRELWKFNLASHTWTKCQIPNNFPNTLASFACQSNGDGSFMVYGGTAIPFGADLDEDVYVGNVVDDKVHIRTIQPRGSKQGCYGHVLVRDPVRNKTFSVGGTDGSNFRLDVHALAKNEKTGQWEWEEYATLVDDGLYRMEAILEKECIYIFGGGTTTKIADFVTIQVFNIDRRLYELVETEPDPEHGYPMGRRCHSLVQWGRQVIIAGGCYDDTRVSDQTGRTVLGCVWSFHLDTFTWRKMGELPIPVYFHDASVTAEGQMLIFGGVTTDEPRGRTSALQTLWLAPPTLFSSALAKVISKVDLGRSGHVLSDRMNITRHVYSEIILPA
ncbi:hypothetical protein PFISCL1PPCAC_16387, partial [Pristionchus fissidentatus]